MRSEAGVPHLRLLEHCHNLLDTESFPFHGLSFPVQIMPETLFHYERKIGGPTPLMQMRKLPDLPDPPLIS